MIRLALLAAVAGLTQITAQSLTHFGSATFRLPSGWQTVARGNSLIAVPPNVPRGQEIAILLTPGQPLRGDFQSEFDRWVQLMTARQPARRFGEVVRNRGVPYATLSQLVWLGPAWQPQVWQFIAANPDSRFELMVVIASSGALYRAYSTDVAQFLATVEYASPTAKEAVPDPARQPPTRPRVAAPPENEAEPGDGALPRCPTAIELPPGIQITVPPQLVGVWAMSGVTLSISGRGRYKLVALLKQSLPSCRMEVFINETGIITVDRGMLRRFPTNGVRSVDNSCMPSTSYALKPKCVEEAPQPWRIQVTPYGEELVIGRDNPNVYARQSAGEPTLR